MGAAPIALADIVAWQTLMDVRLTHWEIDALLQLDSVALAAQTTMDDSST